VLNLLMVLAKWGATRPLKAAKAKPYAAEPFLAEKS
jgi:hypothetical protein